MAKNKTCLKLELAEIISVIQSKRKLSTYQNTIVFDKILMACGYSLARHEQLFRSSLNTLSHFPAKDIFNAQKRGPWPI